LQVLFLGKWHALSTSAVPGHVLSILRTPGTSIDLAEVDQHLTDYDSTICDITCLRLWHT